MKWLLPVCSASDSSSKRGIFIICGPFLWTYVSFPLGLQAYPNTKGYPQHRPRSFLEAFFWTQWKSEGIKFTDMVPKLIRRCGQVRARVTNRAGVSLSGLRKPPSYSRVDLMMASLLFCPIWFMPVHQALKLTTTPPTRTVPVIPAPWGGYCLKAHIPSHR